MTTAGARLRHFSERLDEALVKAAADRGMRFADDADAIRRLRARVTVGDLTLIPSRFAVRASGPAVTLGAVEFAVLNQLMSHPGKILKHERILHEVWGHSRKSRTLLPVTVRNLRAKIGTGDPMIDLVHGSGYILRTPGAFLDPDQNGAIKFADLVLNPLTESAKRGDRPLSFNRTCFLMLERFMGAPGRFLTLSDLADAAVRRGHEQPSAGSIKTSIDSLRRELELGGEPRLIHNKYRLGYVLEQR